MKPTASLAFLTILAMSGLAHASTNLVANGSFELGAGGIGSFSGWDAVLGDAATFVDSSGQTGSHAGQASSGLWSAYFGSTAASGGSTISQLLATTAGQSYVLSFDLANDNAGLPAHNQMLASIAGVQVFGVSDLAAQDYVHEQRHFVASGASTALAFAAYNDTGYLQLDNVAVSAVPEPGMAASWLAGLLALGTGALRQRARR